MSTEKPSTVVELLKYPIAIFSILLALIIAQWALGISFGAIAEIGPDGVKFAQGTRAEIAELAGRLNGAFEAIEQLKKASSQPPTNEAKAEISAAMETVSDHTAQFATVAVDSKASASKRGFIWIGDYRDRWERVKLGDASSGHPITAPPDKLAAGSEYTVLGNMVLRDGLPPSSADYFRARKSLGIAPIGTRVRLLGAPTAVNRGFATQYWAEVQVIQ